MKRLMLIPLFLLALAGSAEKTRDIVQPRESTVLQCEDLQDIQDGSIPARLCYAPMQCGHKRSRVELVAGMIEEKCRAILLLFSGKNGTSQTVQRP